MVNIIRRDTPPPTPPHSCLFSEIPFMITKVTSGTKKEEKKKEGGKKQQQGTDTPTRTWEYITSHANQCTNTNAFYVRCVQRPRDTQALHAFIVHHYYLERTDDIHGQPQRNSPRANNPPRLSTKQHRFFPASYSPQKRITTKAENAATTKKYIPAVYEYDF